MPIHHLIGHKLWLVEILIGTYLSRIIVSLLLMNWWFMIINWSTGQRLIRLGLIHHIIWDHLILPSHFRCSPIIRLWILASALVSSFWFIAWTLLRALFVFDPTMLSLAWHGFNDLIFLRVTWLNWRICDHLLFFYNHVFLCLDRGFCVV